jgi:putative two-component system hydrogenase maturation factor HypX/HoxX
MRILLLCHSFNSLAQRLHVELRAAGHIVSVELDIHDDLTREAVALFSPDLVIAPFLKRAIPEDVWQQVLCLIVHPGIRGDKGPHALDWAILRGEPVWGVTLIEARREMDAGPVWAWREFPMRPARKSDLYREEVCDAASGAVREAVARIASGDRTPLMPANWGAGRLEPAIPASGRELDPEAMGVDDALRIIRAADGDPGAALDLQGQLFRVFEASRAEGLSGPPGTILARSEHRIALGFRNGAIWIGHLRQMAPKALKLPAAIALAERMPDVPDMAGPMRFSYEEQDGVGILGFAFHNGAMATEDCEALRCAFRAAVARPTRVLVLRSGFESWSNGIHLARIEAADSAADESWQNINAMNNLVEDIIRCDDRLVIAAVLGNAGAGGVFLSLAADEAWMRDGIILNPHYKDMGNLYGSEYWTYLLPARTGEAHARVITQARLPMGVAEARALGLASRILPRGRADAIDALRQAALALAQSPDLDTRIAEKRARLAQDEAKKPLSAYREEELARMKRNFYGFDPSYHVARFNFIHKIAKSRTPATLAQHRAAGGTRPRIGRNTS